MPPNYEKSVFPLQPPPLRPYRVRTGETPNFPKLSPPKGDELRKKPYFPPVTVSGVWRNKKCLHQPGHKDSWPCGYGSPSPKMYEPVATLQGGENREKSGSLFPNSSFFCRGAERGEKGGLPPPLHDGWGRHRGK